MKTFRTLFSGGELFGCGARAAGWTHVDGYEIEPKIAAVARLNGFYVRVADVCKIDYSTLVPTDHLHASPSCKRASQANTQTGETEEDLAAADAVCRAIRAHAGQTFTLENVWPYRNFKSFARILAALHACGFVVDYRHINAADYGVPQTRKRLVLRAARGRRVPPLHPTHRKGGDMFHLDWVGWYAAIADLIDTLPETEPAPWQLARLPAELRETMMIGPGGYDGTVVAASEVEPTRAYIVGGGNTQLAQIESHARADGEPMFTVGASGGVKKQAAAYLVEPALTVRSGRVSAQRAYVGRWVRLTVQSLGRFQTVPDDYRGLTAQINGNAVPPLLARRIMESLLSVYEH